MKIDLLSASAVCAPFEAQGMSLYRWTLEVSSYESTAATLVLFAEHKGSSYLPALTDALLSIGFTLDEDWRPTARGFCVAVAACELPTVPIWAESSIRSVHSGYMFLDEWEGARATYKRELLGKSPAVGSVALVQTDTFKAGTITRSALTLDAQIDFQDMTAKQASDIAAELVAAAALMESAA